MDNILAIDTATERCSAALLHGGRILSRAEDAPQRHAALLLGMVDSLLSEAGIAREEIGGIMAGHGPGSFTGVRVAVAAAQGLALGIPCPCCGVSTLATLALAALLERGGSGIGVGVIDARMHEVYLGAYRLRDGDLECVLRDCVVPPARALGLLTDLGGGEPLAAAGTGVALLGPLEGKNICPGSVKFPEAGTILRMLDHCARYVSFGDPAGLEPLYVRNQVVSRGNS
ncbi:MAG: tRNA (adenosine(37)-N6)-threonylcarbamoyltransferase complex dimerization subunit type 1 TsaB [Succinivibrionaceae bacterium]|nr:tRNA (adenosine(37)-N6)-threonylcarbamoyltransferase complex dimerization subunit type 1 TsaB [Succinivibrionaceae bacterium]